jgi:predicted 3-demethylubiquinone-9 3-methyltransferase (glyoxalase superfamily)
MQHTEASVKLFFTNDYARFRMINGNRQLNENKINKIIREIENGNDMLRYYPIQVKENGDRLDILDGQHRFWISKKLARAVFYILVKEEKSMPDIAKINSNVEKWKVADFVNCYVQHGNKNYETIQWFQDTYGISLSVTLKMLSSGSPGNEGANTSMTEMFRNGEFEVKTLDAAVELAEDCKLFCNFQNWRSRAFVIAIYRIKKAAFVPILELSAAYDKRRDMLTQQANYKAYVNTLEQILNVKKQNRIVII